MIRNSTPGVLSSLEQNDTSTLNANGSFIEQDVLPAELAKVGSNQAIRIAFAASPMLLTVVLVVAVGAALEGGGEEKTIERGSNGTFKQIPDVNLNTARIDSEAEQHSTQIEE